MYNPFLDLKANQGNVEKYGFSADASSDFSGPTHSLTDHIL